MVDERTPGSSKSPNERNGVNDNFSRSQLFQYRIVYTTTTIVANNRFTTICTLELRLSKKRLHNCDFNSTLPYFRLYQED